MARVACFIYAKHQIWQSPASRQPPPRSVLTLPSDPVGAGVSQGGILTLPHALPPHLKCEEDSARSAMQLKNGSLKWTLVKKLLKETYHEIISIRLR